MAATAALVVCVSAEVTRAQSSSEWLLFVVFIAVAAAFVIVVIVAIVVGVVLLFRPPAVAAGKDVLDALVCRELVGLARPRGGEGAAVEILYFGGVSGLRNAGYG